MATSNRWRLYITASSHGSWGGVAGLTMHATPGGPNLCTGGTGVLDSGFLIGTPADVFDSNKDTYWVADHLPTWAEYQFASAVEITSYSFQVDSSPSYSPVTFQLQYWDGSTWQIADSQTGQTGWIPNEIRTYPTLSKMKWRIHVTATQDSATPGFVLIAETQLRVAVSGANQATDIYRAYELPGSLETPRKAIDGDTATYWGGNSTVISKWWQYWFPVPVDILEYVIVAPNGVANYAPKTWTLEYWNGSAWIAVDTRTNQANWTSLESRTFSVPPAISTSYTNPEGSGNRINRVLVTALNITSTFGRFVDGITVTTGNSFTAGQSNSWIEFWFPSKKIIDEVKHYQSNTTPQGGLWKWQGSNDRTTWTDIGGTFTFGNATTQIHTTLSGNTTAYLFYRILQTSGTTSSSASFYEFEFKIDDANDGYSYLNTRGSGDRRNVITITSSGITWNAATVDALIDGTVSPSQGWWNTDATNAGDYIQFDFGYLNIIKEVRFWFYGTTVAQGDWKFQGSTDASSWTDLSGTFTLHPNSSLQGIFRIGGFDTNTTAYRYYRILGVSGGRTTSGSETEFEFLVNNVNDPPNAARLSQLPLEVAVISTAPIAVSISQLPVEVVVLLANAIPRVSQLVTEIISLDTPALRTTQLVTELISLPTPALNVSHMVTEVMSDNAFVPPTVAEKTTFQIIA